MSKEIVASAVSLLKSKALECYGIIDNLLKQPPYEGVAGEIASASAKLAQYEGAMITLQQYFGASQISQEPAAEATPPKPETTAVTKEMSPTYRRSAEKEKIKKTVKKRNAKSNNE